MSELKRVTEFNSRKLAWAVVGELGAVHIWVSPTFKHGGIEVHANQPLHEGRPMSERPCWLTGKPCDHDGSSMWWSEYGQMLLAIAIHQGDDCSIWNRLEYEYEKRFVDHNWPTTKGA